MTFIGNSLSVNGTVSASQATKAGECVVLGDDGKVPASLLSESGSGGRPEVVHVEGITVSQLVVWLSYEPTGSFVVISGKAGGTSPFSFAGKIYDYRVRGSGTLRTPSNGTFPANVVYTEGDTASIQYITDLGTESSKITNVTSLHLFSF